MTAKIYDLTEYRNRKINREIEKLWGVPISVEEARAIEAMFVDIPMEEADEVEVIWQWPPNQ